MKIRRVYGVFILLFGLLLAGAFTCQWLLKTPAGFSWILQAVSRHTPVTITARTINGGLGSPLRIEGLSVHWPNGELTVAKLQLRYQPLLLPFGSLAVEELTLSGVRFRNLSPSSGTGQEFAWPHISGLPTMVDAWIDRINLKECTYQYKDQPSIILPDFSAALYWRDSHLSITEIALITKHGRISGMITAGFNRPALFSALTFAPLHPLAGCDRLEFRTRLTAPRQSAEQLAGKLTTTAFTGKNVRYSLLGTIGLTRKELNLDCLTLTESGRKGEIQVNGTLALTGKALLLLSATGLELSPDSDNRTTLSGTLDLSGEVGHYSGHYKLATNGKGWRNSNLTGMLSGNSDSVTLSGINSDILAGKVTGNLLVDWRHELIVKSALQGAGLDPAIVEPTWNGEINFDLNSMAAWSKGQMRHAQGTGRLRSSRLRGKVLTGKIAASLQDDDIVIEQLLLTGKGFDIAAVGALSKRLNLTANISDLSSLIPQTKGRLALKGWGRYVAGFISGAMVGQGYDLAAAGVQVRSAGLSGSFSDGPGRTLDCVAEMTGVSYHGLQVEHATVKADGTKSSHSVTLTLNSSGAEVMARVAGSYADKKWQGELSGLSGQDQVGPWQLAAPAKLMISPHAVTISSVKLTGLPSERAEVSANVQLHPLQITAEAAWNGIDLSRTAPWLLTARLAGQSAGSIRLEMPSADQMTLNGKIAASGRITIDNQSVTVSKALLDLDASERGTRATLLLRTEEGLGLTGRFTSPEPATLAIPDRGVLQASWEGLDPALARRWFPGELDLEGRLAGELTGKLHPGQRFDLIGTLTLADGKAKWHGKEQEFNTVIPTAKLAWNWQENSLQGGVSLSLATLGELRGTFHLPLPTCLNTAFDPAGPVNGSINVNLIDKGILAALFPVKLRDTKGNLEVDLQLAGTWQAPALSGTIELEQATVYFPTAGIRLADWRLTADLEGGILPDQHRDAATSKLLNLTITASAAGAALMGKQTVTIDKALLTLDAGSHGTDASLEFRTIEGVSITGQFNSHEPATIHLPSHGKLSASLYGLDATLAKQWLPKELDLQGQLSGKLTGELLPQKRFDLNGTVSLTDGKGYWREEGQQLTADVRTSELNWNWRNESLNGSFSLSLARFGEAIGSFQLPLPARITTCLVSTGPVSGKISGRVQEKGILTSLFPGLFQETKGLLGVSLIVGGTWQSPTLTGTAELTNAGAYLPTSGIRLEDVQLSARLDGTQVLIDSFKARSGTGILQGSADLSFNGKKLTGYRGVLRGKQFRAVHLPELELLIDPDLSFEGNMDKISANGLLRIPEMQVNSLKSSAVIKPSRDVIIQRLDSTPAKEPWPKLDLQVKLLLGDRVFVKTEGLDARLEGDLNLQITSPTNIKGSGEIRVAKGSFHLYNVSLDIKRGRALFPGGPVERPTLDILALREVENVKAGVTITGTPEAPLLKLYSEPTMPETDILAYLVLGKKPGTNGEQSGLLLQAASMLTLSNKSTNLQDQFKQLVSLDSITLASGKDRNPGYKPIEPSLNANSKKSTDDSGVASTMLQLGKYLTPKLYVSYGRSLFDANQQIRARYTISKKVEVESKVSSTATGGDLYYLIELD